MRVSKVQLSVQETAPEDTAPLTPMVVSISGSSYGCSDWDDIGDTLRRDTLRGYERDSVPNA